MRVDDLRARRDRLMTTWQDVLARGETPPDGACPPEELALLDSWRRSALWVSPDISAAPADDPDRAVESWREQPVAAGLRSVEPDVQMAADDGGLVAAVTDRSGRIVWSYGSRVMQRRSEQVGFVPGGRWDEASVGTNALGLALRTGRAATVFSTEHYSRSVHGWVCYAVPLLDRETGLVQGVLDLSTTTDRAHPLVMSTARALGRLLTSAAPARVPDGPALDLRVLGSWQVRVGGDRLVLPRRQIEVLVLLALHPDGLSLEQLHARLYGDAAVSTATLKAEVSHLRTALRGGIGSRPYRLTVPVDSDLQRVLRALDRGDVAGAVETAGGDLLPGSESPDVCEWRDYVTVALRSAVLGCADVAPVLRLADASPYDEQLQQHLLDLLPAGDPRRAAALARVHRALSG